MPRNRAFAHPGPARMRGTRPAHTVDRVGGRNRDGLTGRTESVVGNAFLAASADAATRLQAAQRKHASLKARADDRLKTAQDRHRAEVAEAASVEADGWRLLLQVPGMTVSTAARIGGTSESTVSRWLARAKETSCT